MRREPIRTWKELEDLLAAEEIRQQEYLRKLMTIEHSAPARIPTWAWYPITVVLGVLAGYGLLVWLRIL